MFTIRSAFVLACASVVSVGLLIAPVASSRLASIQPGTYSGVINVSAGIAEAHGGWSMTVASGGRVDGTLTVATTISFPKTAGCTTNVSRLVFDSHGTFSGVVAGANVVGTWRTSSSFSPSTITTSCGGQSTSTRLPSTPTTSYHGTFPLGQLLKGGSTTLAHVGTFRVTKAPSSSKGSTTSSSSSPSVTIQPPAILAPAKPLPASTAPTPTDSCHEVKSASGQIDVCVPSWLSGSSTPGTTFIDKNGSAQAFSGELPPGDTLKTSSNQYANLTIPVTSSVFSLSPNSSVVDDPGYRGGRHLTSCEKDPANCANAAGYDMSRAASDAMTSAIGGNIPLAMLKIANGVDDLAENATKGVSKAAEILASPNVYVVPVEGGGGRRIANATATATNVEVEVKAAGTTVFVISGACIVLDTASGGFVTVSAGHDLFIPKSAALARKEKLNTSVGSFKPNAVKKWWK